MSDEQKAKEAEVFDQKLSVEDLDAAAGGGSDCKDVSVCGAASEANCVKILNRDIRGGGGFPNCAATVEDGSWCGHNDACYNLAVKYHNFKSGSWCSKAWE